ncbi:MAG: hypothetical protein AAGU27_13295 [Dehalobacterium sp.]
MQRINYPTQTSTNIELIVEEMYTLNSLKEPTPLEFQITNGVVTIKPRSTGGGGGGGSQTETTSDSAKGTWGRQGKGESKTIYLSVSGISLTYFDNFGIGLDEIDDKSNFTIVLTKSKNGIDVFF